MSNDYHRGPWLIDKRLSIGAGFTVRPRDQKNPASFRTFNDADGEFVRRIVRALDQADVAPELLEALKWAMKQGNLGYAARTKGNTAYCDAVDRAVTAIAKAEDNG